MVTFHTKSVGRWLSLLALTLAVFLFSQAGQAQTFDLDARAAFLMDAETGQILFEKNADEQLAPASLTKIVTLLVVMDAVKEGRVSLDDPVRTSRRASQIGGSQVYLAEGETHSLEQMLKAIAIASANDASVAVAEFMAGTEAAFTVMMNDMAAELGMTQSYFANADGLPTQAGERPSVTTARDIAIAARRLITEHPEVLEWTSTVMEQFRESPLFILYNTNRLVSTYDGLDGLKTGYTDAAGWCLVATAKRGDLRLISVVMGTESQNAREERTRTLLDHGFNRFVPFVAGQGEVGTASVRGGKPESIPVVLESPVKLLQPRGGIANVSSTVRIDPDLEAPIETGTPVGEYVVLIDGKEVYRTPVLAGAEAERAGVFTRALRGVRDFVKGLLP